MKLQRLTRTYCPTCHAPVSSEGYEVHGGEISKHVNGQYWEFQAFPCGLHLRWSPAFEHEEIYRMCRKNPDYVAKKKKRDQLVNQLETVIRMSDADEDFKRTAQSYLPCP